LWIIVRPKFAFIRGKRRFRVVTTDSQHDLPIAPNLLNRNFTPAGPNQAWTGDITYSTPSQRSPPSLGLVA
jgi:transposase InsO family protein